MISFLTEKQYQAAVKHGVEQIGTVLDDFYGKNNKSEVNNELPNEPYILNWTFIKLFYQKSIQPISIRPFIFR